MSTVAMHHGWLLLVRRSEYTGSHEAGCEEMLCRWRLGDMQKAGAGLLGQPGSEVYEVGCERRRQDVSDTVYNICTGL